MKLAGAYINDDTYERLVALALSHNRTLAGQCRHLFDRALKGGLQVPDAPRAAEKPALQAVADAQTEKATTPAAAKPALRAVARDQDALPLAGAAMLAETPPGADTGARAPLAAGAALQAGGPQAWPVYENVPVAGMGECVAAAGRPLVDGKTPATGHPPPACCAGADDARPCGGMISNHTPTMMKTHTLNAPRRGRCRPGAASAPDCCTHDNPALKCAHHAAGRSAR